MISKKASCHLAGGLFGSRNIRVKTVWDMGCEQEVILLLQQQRTPAGKRFYCSNSLLFSREGIILLQQRTGQRDWQWCRHQPSFRFLR